MALNMPVSRPALVAGAAAVYKLAKCKPPNLSLTENPYQYQSLQPAFGPALADQRLRRQASKPHLVIVMHVRLVVADEYAGRVGLSKSGYCL
jgi:hypothetical protein